jgi:heterodisulfide reductase subunit B2
MNVSYYPGCSHHGTAWEYTESTKAVSQQLNVDLRELPDWSCCGATSGHVVDENLATSLAARNLSIAKGQGMDLVVPCAACYSRLKSAQAMLRGIGSSDPVASQPIVSLLDLFASPPLLDAVRERVRLPLAGLGVVCYYGCLLVRPPSVTGAGDFEFPESMDILVTALGADALSWSHKTNCCGASITLSRKDIVYALSGGLIKKAARAGAEAIVVACPFCHLNLDSRQEEFSPKTEGNGGIPIFYFTELMGLAFGLTGVHKWLKRHFVDPLPLLRSKGLLQGEG